MGRKSKRSRQVSAQQRALAKESDEQESSYSASDSELNDASLSDDEIIIFEVELNSFELMLQSGEAPNKIPTSSRPNIYRGDSDRKKCCRNSEINSASQVNVQTLFDVSCKM